MLRLFQILDRVASSSATVLLQGETGTGKGAVAQAIHAASSRAQRPFVIVDCGAIAPNLLEDELFGHAKGAFTSANCERLGAFERAKGGTVFLDEVGELPQALQPKLLRAVENHAIQRLGSGDVRTVDVRIIAATNRNLAAETRAGHFRTDLFFRLSVIPIEIPPLRSRTDDILPLSFHMLGQLGYVKSNAEQLLSPTLIRHLSNLPWPGNVRELKNFFERLVVIGEDAAMQGSSLATTAQCFNSSATCMPYSTARQHALLDFERKYVEEALRIHKGRIAQAAQACGVSREYLYRLMRRHGIGGPFGSLP